MGVGMGVGVGVGVGMGVGWGADRVKQCGDKNWYFLASYVKS